MPTDIPQVTVILPAGPSIEDVRERIDSIATQTVRDIEILIAGPRPDSSLGIDDASVHWMPPPPGVGLVGALNVALRAARGEMLAFLMPWWRWHPSYLARQLDELARDDTSAGSHTVSGVTRPDGVAIPSGVWPRGDIAAEMLEHNHPCYLSALMVRRLSVHEAFDDQFSLLAAQDFVWTLAFHERFSSVFELLAFGPAPSNEPNALVLEQSKLVHKHQGQLKRHLGPSGLTAQPGAGSATLSEWIQQQWKRISYWPWSWGAVTALTLPLSRIGVLSDSKARRRFAALRPPSATSEEFQDAFLVGIYLSSKRCPQTGRTFPSTGFDYLANWHASARQHGLRTIVLHDGIDPATIERYTTQDLSFEAITLPPSEESTNDVRFRLFLEFLTRRTDIQRVIFTDVTDVTIRANLFAAMDQGKVYIGGEEISNGASLYIWRVFGKAYGWFDRFRLFPLLQKPVLNCGILGGDRDQVLKLLHGINEELDLSRPEIDTNMVALNLAAYRLFKPGAIVTGHPLHNRFKSYEPREDVYFLHK